MRDDWILNKVYDLALKAHKLGLISCDEDRQTGKCPQCELVKLFEKAGEKGLYENDPDKDLYEETYRL